MGFLGDGINDAPALRAADVGISVDTAVDIAKESADVILLEKDLLVLEEGVLEGRKVFANILKYIRMGASSNFGNMFSVVGASIFLPFVPMAPIQILTNNLLYDFSQVPIPTDDVDPEQIAKPRPVVDERDLSVHPVHRPVQLGLRLHHLFHHALCLRVLGSGPGVAVPDWLVRRVVADTDFDHPRHPHKPDSFLAELGQLAADRDHGRHHAPRRLVALLAHRSGVRLHSVAAALLASPRLDTALLCPAHSGSEDLALSAGLGLGIARQGAVVFRLVVGRLRLNWLQSRAKGHWRGAVILIAPLEAASFLRLPAVRRLSQREEHHLLAGRPTGTAAMLQLARVRHTHLEAHWGKGRRDTPARKLPEAANRPSGEKARPLDLRILTNRHSSAPLDKSRKCTLSSSWLVSNRRPSELRARAVGSSFQSLPRVTLRIASPLPASQTRNMRSLAQAATCLLPFKKAAPQTTSSQPSKRRICLPVSAFHNRTVLSELKERICRPSGEKRPVQPVQ